MSFIDTLDSSTQAALRRPAASLLAFDPNAREHSPTHCVRDSWSEVELRPIEQTSSPRIVGAVEAAHEAYQRGAWRRFSRYERRRLLLRWADSIENHARSLAYLNCLETGRSLMSLEQDSLPKAVRVLRWFAELIDKLEDRSVHSGEYGNDFAVVRREPLGVVVAVLPWNDPMVTRVWNCAPALAIGNSVIVKPSEHATLVLIEAVRLAHLVGIPIGALQVVTGDGRVGQLLVQQQGVEKIAFTGSSATAATIGVEAHKTGLKRLSFECGGKSPFIFAPSGRDIKEFANVVARNMFYNQGQICSAPSIVHVPLALVDALIGHICEAANGFLPSPPLSGGPVGFMVNRRAVAGVRSALNALDSVHFAGSVGEHAMHPIDPDWSITPTILAGLPDDHPFWDTELFAPILLVRPYERIEQALEHAAASQYGLSAGVWSQDIDEAIEIAAQMHAGNVHVNSWGDDPNQVPFGGVKQSGHGREKSVDALDSYSQLKSVFFRPYKC